MASISDDPNGRKRILFIGADGKRRTIRLGKVSGRDAAKVKPKVEDLVNAAIHRRSPEDETARWLEKIDGDLREKLERVGLVESRRHGSGATLKTLCDEFFAAAEIKPGTRTTYRQTERSLLDYFTAERRARDIGPLDAEKWRQWLRDHEKLAGPTVSKRVKTARQMFRRAIKWKMLTENPFEDLIAGAQTNKTRQFFVSREVTQKVLDACPDAEWRLLVALSRYGGLRCPSEHLLLTWQDVLWDAGRVKVTSPKTERYAGGEMRYIPLFPELRVPLLECFALAPDGATYVIGRYRNRNSNLRTQLERILKRAGVKPWPRLFHNLRSTRQTELEETYPSHVVCAWLGNSERVAKSHYLQLTDAHFDRAAQIAAQQPAADVRTTPQTPPPETQNPPVLPTGSMRCETVHFAPMTLTGSELSCELPEKPGESTAGGAQDGAVAADVAALARLLASLSPTDRDRLLRALNSRR